MLTPVAIRGKLTRRHDLCNNANLINSILLSPSSTMSTTTRPTGNRTNPSPHTASVVAENDALRSSYVQGLVQAAAPAPTHPSRDEDPIPKVIVQFWHDLTDIPNDVRACLHSWRTLHSHGFTSALFDDALAKHFISLHFSRRYLRAFNLCYHPAMRCDYFRLCYILINGGFYLDADEVYQGVDCRPFFCDNHLKIKPLCYDTASGHMIRPDLFTQPRQPPETWIFYFNNNPLIAPAGHPIIRSALARATRILLNCTDRPEIQSTTGPGNLTASLVRHAITSRLSGPNSDFLILHNWDTISISPWPLSYRDDDRNWRLLK